MCAARTWEIMAEERKEGLTAQQVTQWWIPQLWGEDSDGEQLRENINRKKNECFLLLDPGVVGSAYYWCVECAPAVTMCARACFGRGGDPWLSSEA